MLKFVSVIVGICLLAWKQPQVVVSNIIGNDVPMTIDGPYVFYNNDSLHINYIDSSRGQATLRSNSIAESMKGQLELVVQTDEAGKTFKVKLRPKHSPEKSNWSKPKKMLVMSDIEGEFTAFRKLLQGNGVINENYEWTYGDGHLVLVGDFVDRGTMVTEVLWLIYALESQAEAKGGKVHFILGNHEIMNMNGELDYVHPRYMAHAKMMSIPYLDIYGQQAELGRWFSTKNVTERIGNVLFAHAGFSSYMNLTKMSLDRLNDTARIYYRDTSADLPSPYSQIIMGEVGPFWYRGYYMGDSRASSELVDSTLEFYGTRFIVTGHTVISRQIVSVYDNRIIDTDVPHKMGYSEALLIEGNKLFRVNANGEQNKVEAKK